ncbi:MAG: DUF4846 domain-containing protein [Bacteroidales bacterium]|nr:DUF4846 domain-containing protein [Bacteroidales bacterium]
MLKCVQITFLVCIFIACKGQTGSNNELAAPIKLIKEQGKTIETRFSAPEDYIRNTHPDSSFATYLRSLELKSHGSKVLYYNGSVKNAPNVYIAVVDMDIGNRDLQQCADAVMRLRGEYLYENKDYQNIHFNFVSDSKPRYYTDYVKGDYSYAKFRKYMNYIFAYANTNSLRRELKPVPMMSMKIGDVFIQGGSGGSYGHAVIVVDMAVNKTTGEKVFMLAQSYMPAQETQILKNPANKSLSPWYQLKHGTLKTPEWTFTSQDLRRF